MAEQIELAVVREASGCLLFATTDVASARLLMEEGDVMTKEKVWIHDEC